MKQFLLTVLCCFVTGMAMSQTTTTAPVKNITVKGIVIDSVANKPLGYGTVALQDAATKAPVKSTLAKDDGSFELKAPEGKTYQLVVASVGYATKVIPVKLTGDTFDAGRILVSTSNKQLNEVTITAVKPVMKQEVDRLSYDVTADPESKAISALDMMRKVPLLAVDGDDNIKLKGSGKYKILINGKESALMAKNPSDVLKAMPATNIEKIEVITTPPAKYDAEGLAGIINIITKKNADQGFNGSINSRYNTVWGTGYNLNITAKQGKFGISGYAGFGKQNQNTNSFTNNQTYYVPNTKTVTSSLLQSGDNTFAGKYRYANAELSYEIDSLNLLTGSFEAFHGEFDQNGHQRTTQRDAVGNTTQGYYLTNNGYNHDQGLDASINYQLGFKGHKDELLTLSYKYSYGPGKNYTDNQFSERDHYYNAIQPDFRQYNRAGNKEHTFQLDYAYPLKKISIEAGAKVILRNNFSDYRREDKDSTTTAPNAVYNVNEGQTGEFDYQQDVYSAYNSYQLKFDKWTGKAGLRLEHTRVNAIFTGTPLDKSYNNLIPSVSIQRSMKSSSLSLGFTQRIQRPGIYQLNPFVDSSNPKFISTGNPDLKPELNNTFELNYSNFSKGSINVGVSYAFSNNAIQNVTHLVQNNINSPSDTLSYTTYTTYQNLGSNRSLGVNLNTNISITKKFTVNVNGQISHIWLKGTYNSQFYKNDGYTGNAFANIAYKFDSGYRVGLDAGFFSGDVTLQGKSSNFIFNSYVVSKEFLNKKLTISAVANNPYSKYRTFRSTTNTADFDQESLYHNRYRNFAVRVNFKFGRLNSEIKKNQRGINNDDTKGGGKSNGGGNG
ncbi:TonB-dependent receptor [Mucilaginibacter sp. CAU 1740]|uniref:TonB-dependent receptor domain-containing protein n=1 Tax=Mucilaginibacter sp. CAU 1740 TaxID=3140365 RepID=UPI00325BD679